MGVFLRLLIVFCFLLNSCEKKENRHREKKGLIQVGIDSPIRSLDPHIGIDCPSTHAIRMIYEGLMRRSPDGKSIVPGIAKKYHLSADRCVYTFYLRKSYWSNGESMTARDFERTWKRGMSPESKQIGRFLFGIIKNGLAYMKGEVEASQVGVHAVDDTTLVVELESPVLPISPC